MGEGVFLLLVAVFCALLLLLAISAEKRHIPASATCILFGALVGALVWPTGLSTVDALGFDALATFDSDFFYYVLLPPIIFEAGFSVVKPPFFANIITILFFAVVGTLLTVVAIGQPLYAIGAAGASLQFGARRWILKCMSIIMT